MPLTVTLDLPQAIEDKLRAENPHLGADVTRAYALELFRQSKLSHSELSQVLHLDRFETDAYLKRHQVYEGSLTMADLEADQQTLKSLFGGSR